MKFIYSSLLLVFSFLLINSNLFAKIGVSFSHERGFYAENFDLSVQTTSDNIKIRFTLDGSEPTESHGLSHEGSSTMVIPNLNRSTVVRVYAYNSKESFSATQTYLFINDVLTQNNDKVINELLYPSVWGYGSSYFGEFVCRRQNAKYGLLNNNCITNEPDYEQKLYEGLMQIPSIAISLDKNQLFGADSGLYVYPV